MGQTLGGCRPARLVALGLLCAGLSACSTKGLRGKAEDATSKGDLPKAVADYQEAERQGEGDPSGKRRAIERLVRQRLVEVARLERAGDLSEAFLVAWGTRDAAWRNGVLDDEIKPPTARLLQPFVRAEIAKADALPPAQASEKLRELQVLANDDPGAKYDVQVAAARQFDRLWAEVEQRAREGKLDEAVDRAERLAAPFPAGSPQQERLRDFKTLEGIQHQATGVQLSARGLPGAALVQYRLADRASLQAADTLATISKRANYYVRATGARGPCGQLSDRVVAALPLSADGGSGVDVEIDLAKCEPKPSDVRSQIRLDDGSMGELAKVSAVVTLSGVARLKNPDGTVALETPIASTKTKSQEGVGAPPNAADLLIEDAADDAAKEIAANLGAGLTRLRAAAAADYEKKGEAARAAGQADVADHCFAMATRISGTAGAAAKAHFAARYGWSDPAARLAATPASSAGGAAPSLSYRGRELTLPSPDAVDQEAERETGLPHFALRAGWGGGTGQLGAGVEIHPWGKHFGIAFGSGVYLLSGGFAFTFADTFAQSGPYLDLHGTVVRPGVFDVKVGDGYGVGATVGYDLRPEPWLSIKLGAGVGKNSASTPSDQDRLLVFDLNIGVVF